MPQAASPDPFISEYIEVLADPNTELFILWQWGSDEVICAIGRYGGGEGHVISDPLNPYHALAPKEPPL